MMNNTSDVREPDACRHCRIPKRDHYLKLWRDPVGYHSWTEPTWEQRRESIIHNAKIRRKQHNA